ncbi:Peptidase M48, Ste24p [Candidatus Magnetomorum sp. HK-1]|nr:Peptidase M48, Ste24p [Candidatus Magnetomorum sp. HK-1]
MIKKPIIILIIFTYFWGGLTGCATKYGPSSQYQKYYDDCMKNVQFNQYINIDNKNIANIKLHYSINKVWNSCLKVALQQNGIISIIEKKSTKQLVFIGGKLQHFEKQIQNKMMDEWFVVNLTAESENTTLLYIAWLSPQNLQATQINEIDELKKLKKMGAKFLLTEKIVSNFFYSVEQDIKLKDIWFEKFKTNKKIKNTSNCRKGNIIQKADNNFFDYGNLSSAATRRKYTVIDSPKIQSHLDSIIKSLLVASGQTDFNVNVYIIASQKQNAFAFPNGDIFVSTALINKAQSLDELAGILAHELSHLLNNDYSPRRSIKKNVVLYSIIAGTAIMVAVFARDLRDSKPDSEPGTPEYIDETLFSTEEVIIGGLTLAASYIILPQLSSAAITNIGDESYSSLSQKQEIRADIDGTEYLWRAGFNKKGWLNLLKRMYQDNNFIEFTPYEDKEEEEDDDDDDDEEEDFDSFL